LSKGNTPVAQRCSEWPHDVGPGDELRTLESRFNSSRKMQPPPSSHIHIHLGYLVVRKLGTPDQYETWMPDLVFDELYEASGQA